MLALVTDSTAYLTKQEAAAWDVRVVPISYTVNGDVYHETFIDKNGDYEGLISRGLAQAQTSQASVATFMSTFEELLRQGYDVLCLTISSRLSGTYSSASVAAREVNGSRIFVVDSHLTGGGLYLLVKKARRLINEGLPAQQIIDKLLALREEIGVAFSVSDLTQLRKSGRLGIIRQSISTILNNKPMFLCIDGGIVSDGVVRGRGAQTERLLGHIPRNATSLIVHYTAKEESVARHLLARIEAAFPNAAIIRRPLGPVLSIHLGESTVGLAWESEE